MPPDLEHSCLKQEVFNVFAGLMAFAEEPLDAVFLDVGLHDLVELRATDTVRGNLQTRIFPVFHVLYRLYAVSVFNQDVKLYPGFFRAFALVGEPFMLLGNIADYLLQVAFEVNANRLIVQERHVANIHL